MVFIDDIYIYSSDEERHKEHVRTVLERLQKWSLFAKLSKCVFSTKSVNFLGFIVTPDGVSMDPWRVQTILEWPVPGSFRDI